MKFDGMHQRVHKEKLPEGLCVAEQNAAHGTRELWTPRQGLARAAGLARLGARIDSVGWGECGLKTALIRADSDGNIHGDAIAAADVSAAWEPPPRRDFFYDPPTLTAEQTDSGEVTLTATSDNPYVVGFNYYRNGAMMDSNVDSNAEGDTEYSAEAVLDSGISSLEAFLRMTAYARYRADNFNRADGTLDSGAYTWWIPASAETDIFNNRLSADATRFLVADTPTDYYRGMKIEADLWHDGLAWGADDLYWQIYAAGTAGGNYIVTIEWDQDTNKWKLYLAGVVGGTQQSAWISGKPPLETVKLTITDSEVYVFYGAYSLNGSADAGKTEPFYIKMAVAYDALGNLEKRVGWDNFVGAGGNS